MIAIIHITKGKILGAKVDEKKLGVTDSYELGWDTNTLDLSLAQIIEKLRVKKIRILIDDSFSYVLRVNVAKNLRGIEERKYVSEKIKEKIPEVLHDDDWDYKEIRFNLSQGKENRDTKEKEVLVFSPVKYLMELISKAVVNLGIEVEAIEPVEIAATRNSNPVIGLALKDDISGNDKDVLNISLDKHGREEDFKDILLSETSELQQQVVSSDGKGSVEEKMAEESEIKSGKKKQVVKIILITIILIFISALGFLFYRDFSPKRQLKIFRKR